MTVFNTFWKVVKAYKGTIILYTVILIVFGALNMSSGESQMNFENTKPDILIINNDEGDEVTENLVKYMSENCVEKKDIKGEDAIDDAVFYRDINYVIYIPENYGENVLKGKNPQIKIKSTQDYNASLAQMLLERYLQIQNIYSRENTDAGKLTDTINKNLATSSDISVTSKVDKKQTNRAATYFSFGSYSILALIIFIVCLVLSSFHEKNVNKRTIISSMDYKKYNAKLLMASATYTFLVWIVFVVLGIIIVGEILLTKRGIVYMANSFIFTFCALTLALVISTLVTNKDAVSGIVNVVALGSAFLCGAFVPAQWLPDTVLKIAHVLPAYWYINSNDLLMNMEVIDIENLKPVFANMAALLGFSVLFIVLNNIFSKKKQKIG